MNTADFLPVLIMPLRANTKASASSTAPGPVSRLRSRGAPQSRRYRHIYTDVTRHEARDQCHPITSGR